jgi:hypothetical protein
MQVMRTNVTSTPALEAVGQAELVGLGAAELTLIEGGVYHQEKAETYDPLGGAWVDLEGNGFGWSATPR